MSYWKQTIAITVLSLLMIGCSDKQDGNANNDPVINKQLQTIQKKPISSKEPTITIAEPRNPKKGAESVGIIIEDDRIIIDTKQTKEFFKNIGKKMKKSVEKIESSLRKEKISSPNDTGIIINDDKLQIDINKTKHFMEKWMRSMESVVNELNRTMKEIEQSLPK